MSAVAPTDAATAELRARELMRGVVGAEDYRAYEELGFISVPGRGDEASGYAYLIYPHRPLVAYETATGRPAHRVLRRLSRRWAAPPGRRRRAREVDRAPRRRARADRHRKPEPARPPDRSRPPAARPRPPARLAGWQDGPMNDLPRPRSAAVFDGPDRAAARAYMKGIGYDDDALQPPDDRDREHVDRGDAVQLPPARPRRADQGGRPRGGRNADGVQHRRDLGRDHDGDQGDEGIAREPRGDRRLDRAHGPRLPVRRPRRARRLRQDDPRRGDGAGAARHPLGAALRRLDRPRPLERQGRDDRRRLRGDRRPRRRQHDRRGAALARGRRLARSRRLRRPVHGQHDGLRLRGAGDLARRRGDGAGRGRREGHRRREGGRAGDAGAGRGPAARAR